MSKYDTYIEQDGSEGVRMTCLGLVSLLAASYYKNGSSFTVTHSTVDPETIGRAIIDHVNSIFRWQSFLVQRKHDKLGGNQRLDHVYGSEME